MIITALYQGSAAGAAERTAAGAAERTTAEAAAERIAVGAPAGILEAIAVLAVAGHRRPEVVAREGHSESRGWRAPTPSVFSCAWRRRQSR